MRRILVVAPHPDDDILGCGETLETAFASGDDVHIAYVTDGAASHPLSRRFPPARLATLREAEATEAIRRLGGDASALHFLRLADGTLDALSTADRSLTIERIRSLIAALRAEFVFLPWRRDPHPDHIAVSHLVREAARGVDCAPRLLEYPVWLPIRGTPADEPTADEVVPIVFESRAGARDRKRSALLAHRSQTTGLIDDDRSGFSMDAALIERFLSMPETFYEDVTSDAFAR